MKYILICTDSTKEYGMTKGQTGIALGSNEIDISEELYNTITFPCQLTLNTNGEVISWKPCELPPGLFPPSPPAPKTDVELLQERILQLEVAEVNRKSKEIEQQIMGGTI